MERSTTIFTVSPHHEYPRRYHHLNIPTVPKIPVAVPRAASRGGDPWAHKAATYAWIMEQELAEMSKKTEETRRWVREQQIHFNLTDHMPPQPVTDTRSITRKRRWDGGHPDLAQDTEAAWFGERSRDARRQEQRHEERNRLLQEEFDRMEVKWRERNERIQRRVREDRRWADEQRERSEKAEKRRDAEAWAAYEQRWAAITCSLGPLSFRTIPWPIAATPQDVGAITVEAVARFILSSAHSAGMSRKDRIKAALRRWHPDRFGRLLSRVDSRERAVVERGVGVVARVLNELMAREN